MARKTIETIVKKRLKWHKTEIIALWFIVAIGAILVLAGIGVYFYVSELTITHYLSTIPVHNLVVSQVKMLHDFSRVLGIVFSLVGLVSIVFALDRLSLTKSAQRMATHIKKLEKDSGHAERENES